MDVLLLMTWFVIATAFLFGMISMAYAYHVRGGTIVDAIAKLILGLIIYGLLTIPSGVLFLLAWLTAAIGYGRESVFGMEGKIIASVFLIIYGTVGWLMCSFIYGEIIDPWRGQMAQTD